MRPSILLTIVAALAVTPAVAGEACLKMRDIDSMTRVDSQTILVNRFHKQPYEVRFRAACYQQYPGNYFIYRPEWLGPCLDRGDALPLSEGGVCMVDQVTPVEAGQS